MHFALYRYANWQHARATPKKKRGPAQKAHPLDFSFLAFVIYIFFSKCYLGAGAFNFSPNRIGFLIDMHALARTYNICVYIYEGSSRIDLCARHRATAISLPRRALSHNII